MCYLSVSTWSLHRLLGPLRWTTWDADSGTHGLRIQEQPQLHTLLELPAEAAKRGYKAIEVCHFHFPSTEPAYLAELTEAFEAAAVSFDTLLLDYGDLSTADEKRKEADDELIRRWIGIAGQAGAKQIRIVAGEAPPTDEEALRRSAASLSRLAEYAETYGVKVITENFKPLTSVGANCVKLHEWTAGKVGFITDYGNFKQPSKYDEFLLTTPFSVSVHAKAQFNAEGMPDEVEFNRCLQTIESSRFDGAIVLIYDGPGDMWAGLERVKQLVQPYLKSAAG
jgi:sugar phosphate isomerase/epimerase